jgi:hypothetical protein
MPVPTVYKVVNPETPSKLAIETSIRKLNLMEGNFYSFTTE